MIKVGFICEGLTEQKLLRSNKFKTFLNSINIEVTDVINAEGCDNLLPHNIEQYIEFLENEWNSEVIIVLTDLDNDACITLTKQRINARPKDVVIIAVKEIEAWFLGCTSVMKILLRDDAFQFDFPENEVEPFETIRKLKFSKTGQGITNGAGGKIKLVKILLSLGLDISEAAQHPNCSSASYFINKLFLLSKESS